MLFEADAEQVEDFALVIVGAGPDGVMESTAGLGSSTSTRRRTRSFMACERGDS
jgi:hypothetical protein